MLTKLEDSEFSSRYAANQIPDLSNALARDPFSSSDDRVRLETLEAEAG
jgi:hypothetical protein